MPQTVCWTPASSSPPPSTPPSWHPAPACNLHCISTYASDPPAPRTGADSTPRLPPRHRSALPLTTSLTALALAALTRTTPRWPLAPAASLSATTLLTLHRQHRRLSP